MGDFENGEEARSLRCMHFFHPQCIDKWLQRDRRCPICKTGLSESS
eukprot:NODE_7763_length_255_cov_41.674757_g7148_i0.p3 GENE.NODE_7763_length_255_cov_41.674757_g7148_i0~~NODE_7763_length_255_cov_41.674757_g7148_i0.p3  ORF type:complete len:54 (-),score=17.88 NODE_7763_length_255_cov_41.674757_g7148_i0:94-231(-)